ncbi:hypothetical protein DaAHT2_0485 [Desulfurivibrio alkaliphilus AHT 2]|uniref:Uncharacterized protein n=1 Tax=Desulfurivibrio alkaliphilus (strain DSM 19089 / UNIQEM U267 / AHT2) TaxID=589865 RepID=D6Z0G2_DESAT|nr:hypothetical protein DaAHT2_0485 [Desulfurivibrio alkaliphilus AHT 2]
MGRDLPDVREGKAPVFPLAALCGKRKRIGTISRWLIHEKIRNIKP